VARIADSPEEETSKGVPFRMADFATFGRLVLGGHRESAWFSLLGKAERVQSGFAVDGDGVVAALGMLLAREGDIVETGTGDSGLPLAWAATAMQYNVHVRAEGPF
jgi:N-acetylglucosamine kinase-like BadF-type ATPase